MKKIITLLNLFCCIYISEAQVGINTSTPSNAAVLELNSYYSATKYGGFMPPRVTEAQRNLIPVTAADDGLIAYVSFPNGDRCLQLYDGVTSTWESIKCVTPPPPPVVVFFEPINNATSTTLATAYTGYSNYPTCTFTRPYGSTAASVNNTSPSNATITTASGTGNFYFQPSANRSVAIGNINLTSHTGPLTLSVLIFKSTQASTGSELLIEYYNGSTLINVSVTNLPTGAGTENKWYERTLSTTVPNTISEIRFSVTSTNTCEFRIDDIKITKP